MNTWVVGTPSATFTMLSITRLDGVCCADSLAHLRNASPNGL